MQDKRTTQYKLKTQPASPQVIVNNNQQVKRKSCFDAMRQSNQNNTYTNQEETINENLMNENMEPLVEMDKQEAKKQENINRRRLYYSVFRGNNLNKYRNKENEKNWSKIYKEINDHKNGYVKSAYINKVNELVIITDNKGDRDIMEQEWPNTAFDNANLTIKKIEPRFFCVLKGISTKTDIEMIKKKVSVAEGIIRLKNRSGEETTAIRLELKDEGMLDEVKKVGIFIDEMRYKVHEWVNRVVRCFKCQLFGHKASECGKQDDTCGKCNHKHRTNECKADKSEYRCNNCKGRHPSWSTNCKAMQAQYQKINPRIEQIKTDKKNSYAEILKSKIFIEKPTEKENMGEQKEPSSFDSNNAKDSMTILERMSSLEKIVGELTDKDEIIRQKDEQIKDLNKKILELNNLVKVMKKQTDIIGKTSTVGSVNETSGGSNKTSGGSKETLGGSNETLGGSNEILGGLKETSGGSIISLGGQARTEI